MAGRGGVLAPTQPFGLAAGIQEPFTMATPAVATAASLAIDGRGLRRLVSLVFTLTTDANVANRYVTVEYRDSAGVPFVVMGAGVVVTAGSTQRFSGQFGRGEGEWAANTDVFFALLPVFLYPGNTLRVGYTNPQAADALSAINGVMERYPLDYFDLPERVD